MIPYDRHDGRRLKDIPPLQSVMPHVMRRRNESAVYFSREIDVERALRYIHERNAALPSFSEDEGSQGEDPRRMSLFSFVLCVIARMLALRPKLDRFVHRQALYQHRESSVAFIVRKGHSTAQDAGEAIVKVGFQPESNLSDSLLRINQAIAGARSGRPTASEIEARIAKAIPFGASILATGFRLLDALNLVPAFFLRKDPLHTSVFVANLGSIGLDAPYHHLYEWGTASIFFVMGRLYQKEYREGGDARHRYITFKVTLDERIADGLYFAQAASLFARFMNHPELLEAPFDPAEAC